METGTDSFRVVVTVVEVIDQLSGHFFSILLFRRDFEVLKSANSFQYLVEFRSHHLRWIYIGLIDVFYLIFVFTELF